MSKLLNKAETINEIVREAQSLDKLDLQIILTKMKVKKMKKEGVKPASSSRKGLKVPTMEEIDLWKHQSRKSYEKR